MEKRRIEVNINGQTHAFVTSDNEEYIRGLADYLNEKISEVSGASYGSLLSNDKKYIVTAMNILDDYYKVLTKYEQLSKSGGGKREAREGRAESASKAEIEEYISRIKALQKENSHLKEKLSNLEYELEYVQNLLEEQKQEYEQSKEE